jgi:superfamily II DNA helicase RecQ
MQLRFFTIPVLGGDAAAEDLNRFLAGQRILSLDRQLVQAGAASAWAICVAFEPAGEGRPQSMAPTGRRGKVDYREVLDEADFAVYAGLRTLRKEIADAEGVPAYALFTNEQMAEMVTRRVSSAAALREIPGIGEGRVEKYGAAFLQALAEARAQGRDTGGEAHEA